MTPLDFSVVVPVFNAAKYLERSIRALLAQTYPANRYEVILVDNNSTDGSDAIVNRFDRVRLLREPEQGSYAARNRGVKAAGGEVVVFTDPDCEPQPDWLQQIHCAMEKPGIGVILGDRRFARDSGILGMLAAYESALQSHIFETQRVSFYYAYTNNMAVRMPILKALNGFQNIPRGADSCLLRDALQLYGLAVFRYAPAALVRHLEIASIHAYLEKKRIYGEVGKDPQLATPQSLPLLKRLDLALQVARECRYSFPANIGFLGTLAAGAAHFEWGKSAG